MYAFVIGNHQNEKKVNVFRVKNIKIYDNDFRTQREEQTLSPTFSVNTKKIKY
jgi:hypothetical protein